MDKNGVVTFNKWNRGQVKHPIYGISLLQNIEAFENKGIAKLKNRLVARTNFAVAPTALPIAEVYDVYGNTYTATGETGQGKVYKNGVAITSAFSFLWDIKIYKDYLFIRHDEALSMYGPLNNSPQYFGGYTGFNGVYNGKLLVGQDDFLYAANGNYIAKVEVTASGTVGVQPTLTVTQNALDLPDGQFATTLIELGKNIMAGTQGGASYSDRGNNATARLYNWNRQAGTLGNPGLADLPVIFSENGVNAMVQHANKAYISAGTQGNIYVSDGVNYQKIATIPYTKSGISSNSTVLANALAISSEGRLLVGLSAFADGISKAGIYEIDIADPAYPITYRTISTLSTGLSTVLKIGFINQQSYQALNVGWSDGSTYGVDQSDLLLYSNYGGVIETDMFPVGRCNSKKTFSHLEWSLAEPLVANQSIRISYRINNKDTFTLIKDYTFGNLGDVLSFEDIGAIADAEYVQLKIELNQTGSVPYGSNINLVDVKIW